MLKGIGHPGIVVYDIEKSLDDGSKTRIGIRGKKIAMDKPNAFNGITIELFEP